MFSGETFKVARLARTLDDGWALRRVSGWRYLRLRSSTHCPGLLHGFSTRKGGASRIDGVAALNLGFVDWDSREAVAAQSQLAAARDCGREISREFSTREAASPHQPVTEEPLPDRVTKESLIVLRQIHSDVVHVFSSVPPLRRRPMPQCLAGPGWCSVFRRPTVSLFYWPIQGGMWWPRYMQGGAARWRASSAKTLGRMRRGVWHQARRREGCARPRYRGVLL